MLNKLLKTNTSISQFIFASIGSLLGYILIIGIVQLYIDFKGIINNDKDLISSEYLIINKPVSIFKTLGLSSTAFSNEEITDLKKQDFVNTCASFTSSKFSIKASMSAGSRFPSMSTDLFFEAIPDNFIDIKSDEWTWNNQKDIIPIILPKDYLNLYNFGFSKSQGLPQISEGMIGMVVFDITIKGQNKTAIHKGKIVGFTNRINTILVPQKFIDWANANYGNSTETNPSRLIIQLKNVASKELNNYIESNNYEANQDKLKASRMNLLLTIILTITSIIGLVILALSFIVFLSVFQIIIYRSIEKIKLLIDIGYNHKQISRWFVKRFIELIVIINTLALLILLALHAYLQSSLSEMGFAITELISPIIILIAISLSVVLIGINYFTMTRLIRRITRYQ